MKEYKWKVIECHSPISEFEVASGSCNNLEDAKRELVHYAFQYAQDYPIKIRKNWKDD